MKTIKTYSELISIPTFEGRLRYLSLDSRVGEKNIEHDRFIKQSFYRSYKWKVLRNQIIIRDDGNDLAMEGHQIYDRICIHHLNPITLEDLIEETEFVVDPEYLVCVSFPTHEVLHYGSVDNYLMAGFAERRPGDTCPWSK